MASSSRPSCRDLDNSLSFDAGSCRGGFDFSLLFEETILEILPIAFILVLAPIQVWQLSQKRRKVVGSWLLPVKLVSLFLASTTASCNLPIAAPFCFCFLFSNCGLSDIQATWFILLAFQIAQTVLWALPSAVSTKASIAANALLSIGVVFLACLSYAEHTRSVRPSFILNTYLFCSLLFDIARARTLWLRSTDSFNEIIAIVTTVAVAVKAVILVLEAVEKRHILKSEYAAYPPEATAGFYNRAVFWWLNPLFKNGFSNFLTVEDLSVLDKELSSERLLAMFEERWSKGEHYRKKKCSCSCLIY